MKNKISEAVGYSIKALHITPNEFFKLLEEVNTKYDDSNYSHWLAKKVIEYAEEMGLAYNEIFTKRVRILNDLASDGSITYNDYFIKFLRSRIAEYEKESGKPFKEISLTESVVLEKNLKFSNEGGIDLNEENLVWLDSVDAELREVLKNNESALVLFEVGDGRLKKDNELLKNAKQFNIQLEDEFDSLLYRLITVVSAVDCSNVKFALLSSGDVFARQGKEELYDLFMQYLKCEEAFVFHPLDVSDSMLEEGYSMLSIWSTEGSFSQRNSCFGLKASECVANLVDVKSKDFSYVGYYNFTFPEDAFKAPEKVTSFEDYKTLSIFNVVSSLLEHRLGFSKVLRKPVNILGDYKGLEVFSVLLNVFSDNPYYEFLDEATSFVRGEYGVLSVEAVSLLEFCEGALKKAKEMGISKDNFEDIIREFNNDMVLSEYYLRVSKLKENLKSMGYLDCFLV